MSETAVSKTGHLRKFAHLALGGLNLKKGQCLAIKAEPENIDVAVMVATLAYRRGARYVDIWTESSRMLRARVDNSEGEYLDYLPGYRQERNREFVSDDWTLLSIKSPVDPAVMDGASAARTGTVARAESLADSDLRRSLSNDRTQWTVMAVPSPKWAAAVLDLPPNESTLEKMWDVMVPILRLDRTDPVDYWHQHGTELEKRARFLTDMQIRNLRFQDDETDLTVGISADAVWKGGGAYTTDGIRFAPNLPTEEVFTTPDFRLTEGIARISRPVRVYGQLLRGAWMEFRDGSVVDYGADSGREALEAFLEVDPGSRAMGEIALVDSSSPIFQSGLLFHNILLDENAACHFALGFAYPTCIRGGASMSDEQLDQRGANRSRQHLDFMIGSATTRVTARCADGTETVIMDQGQFCL